MGYFSFTSKSAKGWRSEFYFSFYHWHLPMCFSVKEVFKCHQINGKFQRNTTVYRLLVMLSQKISELCGAFMLSFIVWRSNCTLFEALRRKMLWAKGFWKFYWSRCSWLNPLVIEMLGGTWWCFVCLFAVSPYSKCIGRSINIRLTELNPSYAIPRFLFASMHPLCMTGKLLNPLLQQVLL